jgi:hypothetical protein
MAQFRDLTTPDMPSLSPDPGFDYRYAVAICALPDGIGFGPNGESVPVIP